ncbi:hypothetical protein KY284_013346 [Solanum tuberosum]|nr:hypothetical protein KY284_013346 [Solanum tuberosum]
MAEWWYNTTFHYAIQTTPYEALYGQPSPIHLPYMAGDSIDEKLKLCHEVPAQFTHPPIVDPAIPYCKEPKSILERRMIKKGNKVVDQLLIQWKNMSKEQATWEDYHVIKTRFPSFFLEDKKVSKEGEIEVEESLS